MEELNAIKNAIGNQYVMIPVAVFWSIVVTIVTGIITNFIFTWNRIKFIEKEISIFQSNSDNNIEKLKLQFDKDYELLKLQVDKDLEILNRIELKLNDISEKQIEIDKKMVLKADKKFDCKEKNYE